MVLPVKKQLYWHIFRDSKSWRASKSLYWFKSYGDFAEWVDFAYCWSCIGKGLPCSLRSRLVYQAEGYSLALFRLKIYYSCMIRLQQWSLNIAHTVLCNPTIWTAHVRLWVTQHDVALHSAHSDKTLHHTTWCSLHSEHCRQGPASDIRMHLAL